MELGFTPKTVKYLKQVLYTGRCREETADTIVPDSCPDVARIVGAYAVPMMRSKECRQGSVTLSGGIRANVIYIGEGEKTPRCLEVYLPFTIKEDSPELTDHTALHCRLFVRSADARMVNSRKVMVRVNLCSVLRGYEPAAETFEELTECPACLQAHKTEYELLLPADGAERSFQMTEELQFPAARPLCGEVFCVKPNLEITEKRLAGNKAVFKGIAHIRILYGTQDGALASYDTELPFSQYCELQDIYDDELLQAELQLTGCEVERTARQEGEGVLLTLHILAQCLIHCRQKITVCDDAYAPEGNFLPKWDTHRLVSCLDRQAATHTVRDSWSGSVSEVADVQAYADLPRMTAVSTGTEIAVPVAVQVLYYDGDGELQGTTVRSEQVETVSMADNVQCRADGRITGDVTALPAGNGMELRYYVTFDVETAAEGTFKTVCGGELGDAEKMRRQRPAVVVRRVQGGERLWDIAKANGTTVERIRNANRLASETAEAGVLLIPT